MTLLCRRDRREERSNESEGKGSGSPQGSPTVKRHLTGCDGHARLSDTTAFLTGSPRSACVVAQKDLIKTRQVYTSSMTFSLKPRMSNLRLADMTKANTQ